MANSLVRLTPLVLAFATIGEVAYAQTSPPPAPPPLAGPPPIASTAQALEPTFLATCEAVPVLEHLTAAYNKGDWAAFQTDARALLDALHRPSKSANAATAPADCTKGALSAPVTAALNYATRYVVLVWVGSSPLGKTQVMRAVVHSPASEPYSADLPGVTGFTEVFLASSLDARAVSLYTSTREKDPFIEQLPEFIKAIFGPLSTTIAGILGGAQGAGKEAVEEPKLAVTVSGVILPIRRASVRAQTKVKDLVSQDDFRDAVATLGTTLLFDGAGRSGPARAQISQLMTELPVNAKASCGPPAAPSSGSAVNRSKACREALDGVLKRAFEAATKGASDKDVAVVTEVDKQFRALAVNALSTSAELDMTFKNRPLTKFTFGAGGAVIANAHLNRVRTKIDDKTGQLVSDPLPRVMTMAFVNWSPTGYDEAATDISVAERVRPFFGVALTPDFGIIGGVNVLLARGIGVVGGIGWLFGKGADAEEIGKPPAAKEDPFKLTVSRSIFVGISYSYK
jgi:hypothetical protein